MKPQRSRAKRPRTLPNHWTPEQALAVFEAMGYLREELWTRYGPHIQQAWREQLLTADDMLEFESGEPF